MRTRNGNEHVDTIVIGGGQAGLAAGYHLTRLGRRFIVLEGNPRVGDSWRNRWDSLRLFTPARFCDLPGVRFPGRKNRFPTKDEMGDYLESYASRFAMDVRTGVRVERLGRSGSGFVVSTSEGDFHADNVIVASGAHRNAKLPSFAGELRKGIVQLHSSEYKNPSQLADGPVLIVGLGNSGAEIAKELSRTHQTYVSGKPSAPVCDTDGRPQQYRGVVRDVPGLYFMGVVFQYAASSDVLPGLGRDAQYIAKHIAARTSSAGRQRVAA